MLLCMVSCTSTSFLGIFAAVIAVIAALASGFALLLFVFIRSALKSASQKQETQLRLSALQASWDKALGR